jgi:hypothetical protein
LIVTTSGESIDVGDERVVVSGAVLDVGIAVVVGAARSGGVLESAHAANAIAPMRSATTADVRFIRSGTRLERPLSVR